MMNILLLFLTRLNETYIRDSKKTRPRTTTTATTTRSGIRVGGEAKKKKRDIKVSKQQKDYQ